MNTNIEPGCLCMVIVQSEGYSTGCWLPPPVGSTGQVEQSPDEDGEAYVNFPDWPCPTLDKGWFIHRSHLVRIDGHTEDKQTETVKEKV